MMIIIPEMVKKVADQIRQIFFLRSALIRQKAVSQQ
jgi:hypothetical protein